MKYLVTFDSGRKLVVDISSKIRHPGTVVLTKALAERRPRDNDKPIKAERIRVK